MAPLSRRALLGALGGAAVGGAALGAGVLRAGENASAAASGDGDASIAFYGAHQAGIVTPQQDRMHFAAFDVTTENRDDVRALLRIWTTAASRMTRGLAVGNDNADPHAPPQDTGEADGISASALTITFGFGPSFFAQNGKARFGLGSARPSALSALPAFPGDELDPSRSDGDLCVQACANDPQVAFHAVRNLARLAQGTAILRWSQLGFGRTASTSRAQETPRNLMGFKDGTNNLKVEDQALLEQHVWIADGPDWLRGGTYLVTRRIRMTIEAWDRDNLGDQERTIGRRKSDGAPLGGSREFDDVDLAATANGVPVIPAGAHIRLAAPSTNGGIHLLRRGYSYTDGIDARTGEHDAGLFFVSFQNDPQRFIAVQRRLAANDALMEYIQHTASGLFAVPRGIREGEDLGAGLV